MSVQRLHYLRCARYDAKFCLDAIIPVLSKLPKSNHASEMVMKLTGLANQNEAIIAELTALMALPPDRCVAAFHNHPNRDLLDSNLSLSYVIFETIFMLLDRTRDDLAYSEARTIKRLSSLHASITTLEESTGMLKRTVADDTQEVAEQLAALRGRIEGTESRVGDAIEKIRGLSENVADIACLVQETTAKRPNTRANAKREATLAHSI